MLREIDGHAATRREGEGVIVYVVPSEEACLKLVPAETMPTLPWSTGAHSRLPNPSGFVEATSPPPPILLMLRSARVPPREGIRPPRQRHSRPPGC